MVDYLAAQQRGRRNVRLSRWYADPGKPKHNRKRRILVAGGLSGAVLVAGAAWLTSEHSPMPIRSIEVIGTGPEQTPAVLSALGAEIGQTFGSVDVAAAQARVDRIDGVLSATVQWTWWNTLTVQVAEQVPAGAIAQDGSFLIVDAAGDTIRTLATRPPGLPLIEGTARKAALQVAHDLPPETLPGIEAIIATGPHDVRLRLVAGPGVILGEPQDVARKIRLVQQLGPTGARTINVSVPDRPALLDLPAGPKS